MNKLFIGLLIVAAGAGIFIFLNKKKNEPLAVTINKELLTGKWKTAIEQQAGDTAKAAYQYEFREKGILLRSLSDSSAADTSHYEWDKNNDLVWKENQNDSIGKAFTVLLLTKDSLQLQSKDSSTALFLKTK